jgi:hypothetical protein
MVARLVAVFQAEPQQQLKQMIRIGGQGGEQLVTQPLTVGDGACRRGCRSQRGMARASGGAAWRRIILTIEPALNRRSVELGVSHQMGDHVFDQPLITGALLVPSVCWEAGKIVLEALGCFPKQIGSFFPSTHWFTPQWNG